MNPETYDEDAWVISRWRSDTIPSRVQAIKQFMANTTFPDCCRQVLFTLDKYFEASDPENIQSPALFVSAFLDELIEKYLLHVPDQHRPCLTALQELRLLELLSKHFQQQKSEFVGWCVFDTLFSFTKQEQKEKKFHRRMDLLTKLVSMAIALRNGHVMDCMALWMQKHRHAAQVVVQVATSVVADYTCLVPVSLSFLQSVSSSSPQLACQLIVALTSFYIMIPKQDVQLAQDKSTGYGRLHPTLSTLKVVVKWISGDPSVCLIKPSRTLTSLPSLHNPPVASTDSVPLPLCPVQGLVQWTVLEPLTRLYLTETLDIQQSVKEMYSQLHLGLLQALIMSGRNKRNPKDEMELEPGEVMDEADTLRHLIKSDDLKCLTKSMMILIDSLNNDHEIDQDTREGAIRLSMDRIAQIAQVSVATGCLSSSKDELLAICKSIPQNRLLETVICNLD